jgi:outer membrane protein OmpA-like peptidoglycan-associated protein/opacity protein-like surface antigen
MKKLLFTICIFSLLSAVDVSFAQLARTSWSFGFGLDYPTFYSSDVRPKSANFGGFLSLQHNFYESVALRLTGAFDRMEATLPASPTFYFSDGSVAPSTTLMHSNLFTANLDLLYYFSPCSVISPYVGFGPGVASFKADWGNVVNPNAISKTAIEMNFYLGGEWKLSSDWNLKTEVGYHSTDEELDGIINNNRQGLFNSDAVGYITINAGLQYYFWKGEPSRYCEIYSGIKPRIANPNSYPTLDEIDNVVKKHIPQIVEKKVEVEVPTKSADTSIVLFGVNFAPGKSELAPEAYPVLLNTVQKLKDHPDIKVEIQGYTDNAESPSGSQKLSEERANVVKKYLVSQGIEENRITATGLGDKNPVADNGTELGRARNRRIEFQVIQ